MKRVLLTGGAGFVGSFLAERLLSAGYAVRALDNLWPQVHPTGARPDYLDPDVELMVGDVRDEQAVRRALQRVDFVVHLAACVGVGQSMAELGRYADVNTRGTAVLLEALIRRPVERLLAASSMSVYGEGRYTRPDGVVVDDAERSAEQLQRREWDVFDGGHRLAPVPTPETKPPRLYSMYALGKFDQERMCMMVGRTYGMPVTALRFFNIFGPRQALTNPYTGVLANFASRLLMDRPPLIYEDGQQRRDFVSIHDVAQACLLALEKAAAAGRVFNIGSGNPMSVLDMARAIALAMNKGIEPEVSGRYRLGDIRHCFADTTQATVVLGFIPNTNRQEALIELAQWVAAQPALEPDDGTHARGVFV